MRALVFIVVLSMAVPARGAAFDTRHPFGLMLQAPGMSLERRIALVKDLGGVSFRPGSIFVQGWNGHCPECDAARRAGLRLILTVRNNGSGRTPTSPPHDLAAYRQTVGRILDQLRPALLVVENEENSNVFYTGTPAQYGAQLREACAASHERGIPCTNGGLVSGLVALLTWRNYLDTGQPERGRAFADRAFSTQERGRLESPRIRAQIARGQALLEAYREAGMDYLNVHWYIPNAAALGETVGFLRSRLELPVLSNEVGQRDQNPATTRVLMAKLVELKLPVVVWFSIDVPGGAVALMNPDGSLRPTGVIFKAVVATLQR